MNLSEDEVAASNKWYQTCASFKIAATHGHEAFPFIALFLIAQLKFEEETHLELNTTNKWQGVRKKAKGSVFLNFNPTNSEPVCWNCGKKVHTMNKCHEPKDPEAI